MAMQHLRNSKQNIYQKLINERVAMTTTTAQNKIGQRILFSNNSKQIHYMTTATVVLLPNILPIQYNSYYTISNSSNNEIF